MFKITFKVMISCSTKETSNYYFPTVHTYITQFIANRSCLEGLEAFNENADMSAKLPVLKLKELEKIIPESF